MHLALTVRLGLSLVATAPPAESSYDVVMYGATSAGVAAAVQTARMGRSVVLLEPGKHLGGLAPGQVPIECRRRRHRDGRHSVGRKRPSFHSLAENGQRG